jgi:4-diphosphocytidyl-2-C-methyl-D-erythritol kinase
MTPRSIFEFAPAKVNLALHVLGRRADGYHELDSIVAFADVGDRLTLARAEATSLTLSGPFADGLRAEPDNLVLRAFKALGGEAALAPVAFHLEKNLPIASGIGGGSADAAAALRGLARLFDVPMGKVADVALSLGADVPVCLHGKPCRMTGIGEHLEPMPSPSCSVVLANPSKKAMTADVFKGLGLMRGDRSGTAVDASSHISAWRNDLTPSAIGLVPEIREVIAALNDERLISCARMSGSGATCFGLAASPEDASQVAEGIASAHPGWWVRVAILA